MLTAKQEKLLESVYYSDINIREAREYLSTSPIDLYSDGVTKSIYRYGKEDVYKCITLMFALDIVEDKVMVIDDELELLPLVLNRVEDNELNSVATTLHQYLKATMEYKLCNDGVNKLTFDCAVKILFKNYVIRQLRNVSVPSTEDSVTDYIERCVLYGE